MRVELIVLPCSVTSGRATVSKPRASPQARS